MIPVSEVLKAGGAIKEPQIIDLRLFYDHFGLIIPAEKEGFEPPVQLPVHRISSAARSTTLAAFLVSAIDGANV